MAAERITFVTRIRQASPPWLQRSVGGRVMAAIAGVVDTLVDRTADGVAMRFPGIPGLDNTALVMIGRERRIRRGPGESVETYARRIRPWWDRHRVRGGPYALLGQLYHFFLAWLNVRMDVVYHSGTRRWIDVAGEITRDSITWSVSPDGSDDWSQVWVMFWCPELIPLGTDELVTTWNELIVTFGGETIGTSYSVSPGALTSAEAEVFKCIPREWSAAHVKRTRVVLLHGFGELWDYHAPDGSQTGTWAEWEDVTKTFDQDAPTILVLED